MLARREIPTGGGGARGGLSAPLRGPGRRAGRLDLLADPVTPGRSRSTRVVPRPSPKRSEARASRESGGRAPAARGSARRWRRRRPSPWRAPRPGSAEQQGVGLDPGDRTRSGCRAAARSGLPLQLARRRSPARSRCHRALAQRRGAGSASASRSSRQSSTARAKPTISGHRQRARAAARARARRRGAAARGACGAAGRARRAHPRPWGRRACGRRRRPARSDGAFDVEGHLAHGLRGVAVEASDAALPRSARASSSSGCSTPISLLAAITETSSGPVVERRGDLAPGRRRPSGIRHGQRVTENLEPVALERGTGVQHRRVLDRAASPGGRVRGSAAPGGALISARLSLSVVPLVKTISRGSRRRWLPPGARGRPRRRPPPSPAVAWVALAALPKLLAEVRQHRLQPRAGRAGRGGVVVEVDGRVERHGSPSRAARGGVRPRTTPRSRRWSRRWGCSS